MKKYHFDTNAVTTTSQTNLVRIANQQDNQNKTNEHSNTTIDNPSTQVQENDIKCTDQQSPSTVNIKIENEDKSTPFKDGVGKGFGTGCGCLLSILATLTILALILSEIMS